MDGMITLEGELYLAPPSVYVDVLRQTDDDHARVLVVGHNPGIEELLHMLAGSDEPMPTAALAHLTLEVDRWRDLDTDTKCVLEAYWCPKELDE